MFYYSTRLSTTISRPTLTNLTLDTTSTLATLNIEHRLTFWESEHSLLRREVSYFAIEVNRPPRLIFWLCRRCCVWKENNYQAKPYSEGGNWDSSLNVTSGTASEVRDRSWQIKKSYSNQSWIAKWATQFCAIATRGCDVSVNWLAYFFI